MTPWFHIPSLSGCCGEFLAVGLSGHCLTRSELCNGSGEERGCEGFSSLSSQEKSTSAVRASSLGRDPALEFPLTWGVCGMGRGGRRVRPEVLSAAAHPVLLPPPPQGISSAPGLLLLDESTFKVLACELGELG